MDKLTKQLIGDGVLKSKRLIFAFNAVNRHDFVKPGDKEVAHIDAPLSIGEGQTISQPWTVAFMLELLAPQAGDRILDVGVGSGWTTALLARAVGEEGRVFGLEINKEIFQFGKKNLRKKKFGNYKLYNQSGWEGLEDFAPFDKILVSAAAEEVPKVLKAQLKLGGRLVMPVGRQKLSKSQIDGMGAGSWRKQFNFDQSIVSLDKISQNKYLEKSYPGFIFVPLIK